MKYFILIYAAMFAGWVANIYKLVTCGLSISELGAMEIVRIIGIPVAPLGAILGIF